MSDEIDIEEHDVMDNPSIKRIFPDLSVIKKEINKYYDEALIGTPGTTQEEIVQQVEITNNSEGLIHTLTQNDIDEQVTSPLPFLVSEATESQNKLRYLQENIIILGSKPNLECKNNYETSFVKEPKLLLKKVDYFLNKSERYCKECLILFPKAHLLNLHLYDIHKKKNNQDVCMEKKQANKSYKCDICDKSFTHRSNLYRHLKNLHKNGKIFKPMTSSNKKKLLPKAVSQSKRPKRLPCFHCQNKFPNQTSLIEHLYEVLEPDKIGSSDRSASAKEANKEQNFNDTLPNDEFVQLHKDNRVYNNDITNNSATESMLPEKNILKRVSFDSVVALAEYDDDNVKGEKRKTAQDLPVQDEDTNVKISMNTNKCNECTEQFNSLRDLRNHIRSVHRRNIRLSKENRIKTKLKKNTSNFSSNKSLKKSPPSTFYQCFVCSKYNVTFEYYARHIRNDHDIKVVTESKKVPFDPHCKLCSSKTTNMKTYNVHLYKNHRKQLKGVNYHRGAKVKINSKIQFALKDVLYKCVKCDIFFLSSKEAMNHSTHVGNTWNCSVCQRKLKIEDMIMHEKQHSFSQTFTVHTLTEFSFSLVLYKCSNCTVHYSEDEFLIHYIKCDSETPNSFYCKVCDILINRDDMEFHGLLHNVKKVQYSDFIIIESDLIDNGRRSSSKAKNDSKKDRESSDDNSKLTMYFCQTCKCFITNVNLTRKLHLEGRCGHVPKTVCKDCGLMFTMKTHQTHKQYHKDDQINLQDYLFFDLKSKKQICPPIPAYPNCNMCRVHFLRHSAIKIHSCREQDYITCSICSIKLTEHAYRLHFPFHSYSIERVNTEVEDPLLQLNPSNDENANSDCDNMESVSHYVDLMIVYTCKGCHLTVNTYDRVVQHCQDHYDYKKTQIQMQKCQICNLKFLSNEYKSHKMLHLNGKYNDSVKVVEFDPFYFCFDNDFWTKHIFAYVADEHISKILDGSMYRYECRLKMEQIQPGSSKLMLYKCDKCQVFIDPQALYIHAFNAGLTSCVKLRKHACSVCGLLFASSIYRAAHEKEHENINISSKSYKILLFNKVEHESYNKVIYDANSRYILYQCRNCEGVVDKFERNTHECDINNLKICSACGLLFHKKDFDLHFIRHEELIKFNAVNIIVIMFGKLCFRGKKVFRSTFSGTKYNYKIYKCKKCDLCLETKRYPSDHVCVFDDSKCKCSRCGLYFLKFKLIRHTKRHECSLDYDALNINILTFEIASSSSGNTCVDPKDTVGENKQIEEKNDETSLEMVNTTNNLEKLEIMYKCDCGLCFLEELNAQQHANNCNTRTKISKQSCIKCDLLFTPGELFNHLLKHHCDKKLQIKFDIVPVHKKEKK